MIRAEPGLTNVPIELIRKSDKDEKPENFFARPLTDPTNPTVDTAMMLIGLPSTRRNNISMDSSVSPEQIFPILHHS